MSEKCLVQTKLFTSKIVDFYIRGSIDNFEDYDDMVQEIAELTPNDSVVVHLCTPGGDCSVGFFLIDQLRALNCHIHMVVEYPTYSMGAIMALCGHKLTITPGSYIMFHDFSTEYGGKGEESEQYIVNFRRTFKDRFKKHCVPFLSRKESERMFKGEDIYIHHDDPTLAVRTARHFK